MGFIIWGGWFFYLANYRLSIINLAKTPSPKFQPCGRFQCFGGNCRPITSNLGKCAARRGGGNRRRKRSSSKHPQTFFWAPFLGGGRTKKASSNDVEQHSCLWASSKFMDAGFTRPKSFLLDAANTSMQNKFDKKRTHAGHTSHKRFVNLRPCKQLPVKTWKD